MYRTYFQLRKHRYAWKKCTVIEKIILLTLFKLLLIEIIRIYLWMLPAMRTNLPCFGRQNPFWRDEKKFNRHKDDEWDELWKEALTNETQRHVHLTWLPTVLKNGGREMPKHWMEEKVYWLENFQCAFPKLSVRWQRNKDIRCLNCWRKNKLVVSVVSNVQIKASN